MVEAGFQGQLGGGEEMASWSLGFQRELGVEVRVPETAWWRWGSRVRGPEIAWWRRGFQRQLRLPRQLEMWKCPKRNRRAQKGIP